MVEPAVLYDAVKYPNFKEFLWFEAHEEELLREYYGRYIIIKDEKVIGDFGSRRLARQQALKQFEPGTFIIHFCAEKDIHRAPRLNGRQLVTVDEK